MNLIKKYRIIIGKLLLKGKLKKLQRLKKVYNLNLSQSIVLVCVYTSEKEFKIIEEFISTLSMQSKKVDRLIYVPDEKLLELNSKIFSMNYITKNEFNFFYIPKSQRVKDFISKDYDILIDLNINNQFPMESFTALSNAHFKVGVFDENKNYIYDMLIKISNKLDLSEIIEQCIYYLNLVNPPNKDF